MKNSKLNICNTIINPGEIANLALPLPEEYSCNPLFMPIRVIHGNQKGPCLIIFSILKGDELNGLEIANQIVDSLNPNDIKGTLIAIPVLNVYGLTRYPSSLPTKDLNLVDCFPGSETGSYGERLAHLFTHQILKKGDYCIELQTGAKDYNILPQVYCNFDNKKAKQLARIFQTPVITNVTLEGNLLRQTTQELNIPLLVYQGGEAMRFDEGAIKIGVQGVLNVMRAIDILPATPLEETTSIFSQDEDWILSSKSGILHTDVSLGQVIKKNELIGRVSDPFSSEPPEKVKAPHEGVVVGINTTPLIHEGLPIFKIATFIDNTKAENTIEAWDKKQIDSYIGQA
jgi:predicted deacylase